MSTPKNYEAYGKIEQALSDAIVIAHKHSLNDDACRYAFNKISAIRNKVFNRFHEEWDKNQ